MVEDLAKLVKMAEGHVSKQSSDITDIFKTITHIQKKAEEQQESL